MKPDSPPAPAAAPLSSGPAVAVFVNVHAALLSPDGDSGTRAVPDRPPEPEGRGRASPGTDAETLGTDGGVVGHARGTCPPMEGGLARLFVCTREYSRMFCLTRRTPLRRSGCGWAGAEMRQNDARTAAPQLGLRARTGVTGWGQRALVTQRRTSQRSDRLFSLLLLSINEQTNKQTNKHNRKRRIQS